VIENNKLIKRHEDCYLIGASDVPAAGFKSGQPHKKADTRLEHPPMSGPEEKG
jgi:hypothetical protein